MKINFLLHSMVHKPLICLWLFDSRSNIELLYEFRRIKCRSRNETLMDPISYCRSVKWNEDFAGKGYVSHIDTRQSIKALLK